VNGYLWLWLTCLLLSACCCWQYYLCRSLGELSTHLAPQTLFTQSSVRDATATSFPLSKHTGGGGTAPAFSGLPVYLQFMWEVGLPPSCGVFLPPLLLQAFLLLIARHVLLLLVVCVFLSRLGAGNWWRPRGPPGFSVQCEVEMLCTTMSTFYRHVLNFENVVC
jgi:hypothetical protein